MPIQLETLQEFLTVQWTYPKARGYRASKGQIRQLDTMLHYLGFLGSPSKVTYNRGRLQLTHADPHSSHHQI